MSASPSWFVDRVTELSGEPWLQGLLAAAGTLVLEDATTISCALLVAEGRMDWRAAYAGLTAGIILGDFGLYLIGRLIGRRVIAWRLVSSANLNHASGWLDQHLLVTLLVSRCVPGLRLPMFIGAGVLGASATRFLLIAIMASALWTGALLTGGIWLGERLLPALGQSRWLVLSAVALTIALFVVRYRRKAREAAPPAPEEQAPVTSFFEFWPPWLFYAPVGVYYAWLALWYRSITLPTAANPSIYSGGLVGESKSQILGLVGQSATEFIARWVAVEKREPSKDNRDGKDEKAGLDEDVMARSIQAMRDAGLSFPLVAKPDMGQRGDGVQVVRDEGQLAAYIDHFPAGETIILQELIDWPHEAGLMWVRHPDQPRGRVVSITLKEFPAVTGDGCRTLGQLIDADERASILAEVYKTRHAARLADVPPAGEDVSLVFAGNHCKGTIFRDGIDILTDDLEAAMDRVGRSLPGFYFGRFDVRFHDLASFRRGEHFKLVEINGAGAEATHIWDARMTLRDAWGALFRQWRTLFEIGHANRRAGAKPLPPLELLRAIRRYDRVSRGYPPTH